MSGKKERINAEGTPTGSGAAQGDALAAKDAWSYADHGLKLLPARKKPEAMPDADFATARDQSAAVFYGAAGLHSLAAKDFATARDNYQKSLAIQPSNFLDLYHLGLS